MALVDLNQSDHLLWQQCVSILDDWDLTHLEWRFCRHSIPTQHLIESALRPHELWECFDGSHWRHRFTSIEPLEVFASGGIVSLQVHLASIRLYLLLDIDKKADLLSAELGVWPMDLLAESSKADILRISKKDPKAAMPMTFPALMSLVRDLVAELGFESVEIAMEGDPVTHQQQE